jgi:DTW domain-containing protein
LPARWCICDAGHAIECPLQIDVMMDRFEQRRPSSTGLLIHRLIPSSRLHVCRRGEMPDRTAVVRPDRALWILHPRGDPMPAGLSSAEIQVVLLDGNWREAGAMRREMESWGRKVSLPMTGASRYWLRSQPAAGHFSSVEALAFLLGALGHREEQTQLRLQFELHVYAGLLARGRTIEAERYLEDSPVRAALPVVVARLQGGRRPPPAAVAGKGGSSGCLADEHTPARCATPLERGFLRVSP